MDSNDFIFSDDAAESLGFRTTEAERQAASGEVADAAVSFVKARLGAVSVVSLAVLSVMESLTRSASL